MVAQSTSSYAAIALPAAILCGVFLSSGKQPADVELLLRQPPRTRRAAQHQPAAWQIPSSATSNA